MSDATQAAVTAANPWASVVGSALSGMLGGGPAGPSMAYGGSSGGMFDSSGWNVSFGDNSPVTSDRTQQGELSQYLPYVIVAGVFLVAWRAFKK